MAYGSWQEAVRELMELTKAADDELLNLARLLRVTGDKNESRLMVIARVEDAIANVTRIEPPRQPTEPQLKLLVELGTDITPLTVREASALIRYAIAHHRCTALEILKPIRGDQLILKPSSPITAYRERSHVEVSSIDRNGNVWIRGSVGYPIRPQHLERP